MWHREVYVCVRNLGARSEMSVCFSVTAQGRELSLSIHNADEGKQFHRSLFEADKSQATKETSLLTIKNGWFCCRYPLARPDGRALCFLCLQMNCAEYE